MVKYTEGMRVVIVEDCRPGGVATGQTATFEGRFAVSPHSFPNPRFRLQDGTVIWGYECWWQKAEEAGPLPEMQAGLERLKRGLRRLLGLDGEEG